MFGLFTVASALVTGKIVGQVVVPAFDKREAAPAVLALGASVLLGLSLLKVCAIFGRRLGAGYMQYRLQAAFRRRVTRRYLELPLSWHHRNATGTLLSNANSDVEAAWYPIAPMPFAVGTLVMLVGGVVSLFAHRLGPRPGRPGRLPGAVRPQRGLLPSDGAPRQARAQRMRAEVSGIAHESFDGALVVKTMGRETQETDRFAARAGDLRDALISVGRLRGVFDPMLEPLPSLGTLAVLVVGAIRLRQGAITIDELVSVAFLFTVLAFPVRAIGWVLAELPRSVAGWDRVRAVLDADRRHAVRRRRRSTRPQRRPGHPRVPRRALRLRAGRGAPARRRGARRRSRFDVPAGKTVALVGPTGSGKSTIASLAVRLVDPALRHGAPWTASTSAS